MGFFSGILRTVMFIFNFACLLVGIVLISVGTVFYISVDHYEKVIEEAKGLNIVPGVTIGVGVFIFFLAFLGCCGAMTSDPCMLKTYAGLLIILLIVQLSIGIYGIVKSKNENFKKEITEGLKKTFARYDTDNVVKDVFQSMQSDLKCCGINGPLDYFTILKWTPGVVAGGCCGKPREKTCLIVSAHLQGCMKKLPDTINKSISTVAYVALGICIVELLGAIFASCLIKSK